jgi:hypothetical protein
MNQPPLSIAGSGATTTTTTFVPSCSTIQYRRSTRTALYVSNGKSDDPNKKQQFPRRWPGIGNTFQCKVPTIEESMQRTNNKYESNRPLPLLMSNEYPHCMQQDIERTTHVIIDSEMNGKVKMRNVVNVSPLPSISLNHAQLLHLLRHNPNYTQLIN